MTTLTKALKRAVLLLGLTTAGSVLAHGNVTPTAVKTEGLTPLGSEWRAENPYRTGKDHDKAVEIGASAYNQNCAACHGLEAKSGGIAPDLRQLDEGEAGDEWFVERVRNGAVRDGRVYMPKMADFLSQEALWAVRTYLDSVRVTE
ncbi:cytochrome c-550 PedF [Pseudomonas cremoricolorata]|uniref:Cytochrome C n=1 Tax=Pseudomonas cremoricolorata TaxID=157783 RepID=A0A089WUE7_9PSED|nr:cytochrome c-550 PedF [Pseudomonas cremoricolorata]AIR90849.1 cytochrome C [Pseudomonas cremoricolorata]